MFHLTSLGAVFSLVALHTCAVPQPEDQVVVESVSEDAVADELEGMEAPADDCHQEQVEQEEGQGEGEGETSESALPTSNSTNADALQADGATTTHDDAGSAEAPVEAFARALASGILRAAVSELAVVSE